MESFQFDNALIDTSVIRVAKIDELIIELFPRASYSSDLGSSDYFQFANLKKWLDGNRLVYNNGVKPAVEQFDVFPYI